jgi:hypothetical protein
MKWGYLGGALWAALLFGGLSVAVARHRKQQRSWDAETRLLSSASVISMGGLMLHGLVDFPLQIPSLQLYAAVLLGLLWNLPDARRRFSKTRASDRTQWKQAGPQTVPEQVFSKEAKQA